MKLCLFTILFVLLTPASADMEKLLDAIRQVESSGGVDKRDGDDGKAIGPYQIHRDYWTDGTKFLGVAWPYEDAKNEIKARKVVRAYLNHYGKGLSLEAKARIHNGGPQGHKKESTKAYWHKVRKEMQ
jgi:hypothetical protein